MHKPAVPRGVVRVLYELADELLVEAAKTRMKHTDAVVPLFLVDEMKALAEECDKQNAPRVCVYFAVELAQILDCSNPLVLSTLPEPFRTTIQSLVASGEMLEELRERDQRQVDSDSAMAGEVTFKFPNR